MASIFAKGRVIALASVHSLLDAAIDVNSIPVLKQHIRDLEEARENMEGQLVEQRGNLRRAQEKAAGTQKEIADLKQQASLLKSQGKMESALALAGRLSTLEEGLTKANNIETLKATVDSFDKIVSGLKSKEGRMKADLERLASLDATAKNAEKAAAAIKNAAGAMDVGSIDNLSEKIENRAAKATGALQSAMGSIDPGVDADVERAKAEARLAAL